MPALTTPTGSADRSPLATPAAARGMPGGRRRRGAGIAALCAALTALAAPAAQAIAGDTDTSAFQHVGYFGVQVAPNWVLTAAHTGWAVGGSYSNGFGAAQVAAVYTLGPGPFPADDLMLLRLDSAIAAPQLTLVDTVLPAGTLGTPLGVTMASGANASPRGTAANTVVAVLDQVQANPGDPLVSVNWLATQGPGAGAPHVESGDSGGALFVGSVSDSTGAVLIGIASALEEDTTSNPGSTLYTSYYLQLAAYRSWIDGTMAADATDSQVLAWVSLSAVPEPGSALLALAGLGLLGGTAVSRRARRGLRGTRAAPAPRG